MDKRFTEDYIEKLAHKYKEGTLSPEELADIEYWYTSHDDQVFAHADASHPNRVKTRMLHKLLKQVKKTNKTSTPSLFRRWWVIAVAAIFVVAVATGLYFYPNLSIDRHSSIVTEVVPGGNKATLTLSDGTKIDLDSAEAGIQINDEAINYNDGTKIKAAIHHSTSITYNLLTTPKGGQYQIILSDGTKVWLNAASTLKYPSRFNGDSREVFLEGEAYFLVAKSKKQKAQSQEVGGPFIVKSRGQAVLVLGTEFNLSAYADEKSMKTTLVSGAVQVASNEDNGPMNQSTHQKLIPGQQAVNTDGQVQVKTVDIHSETAWRYGKFIFTGKPFKQVMNELARWYDLEVVYEGDVPNVKFFGGIKRDNKLSAVLHVLEDAGIDFSLQNNRRLLVRALKNNVN